MNNLMRPFAFRWYFSLGLLDVLGKYTVTLVILPGNLDDGLDWMVTIFPDFIQALVKSGPSMIITPAQLRPLVFAGHDSIW